MYKAITISAYAFNLQVTVCCVPGYSGMAGNEISDQMAATAALANPLDITVPH